jgi:Na+/H+-dicarboxylate symporter
MIVLGVGSIRKAATVGKVGGLALAYFLVMSMIALIIGLLVGNLLEPGAGLNLSQAQAQSGQAQAGEAESTTEFLSTIIPTTLFSALFLLIVSTSSSDVALPRLIAKMEHLDVSRSEVGITGRPDTHSTSTAQLST